MYSSAGSVLLELEVRRFGFTNTNDGLGEDVGSECERRDLV